MATIWKGQLTFGLVSFPVRLQKAARRERIALKYVREARVEDAEDSDSLETEDGRGEASNTPLGAPARDVATADAQREIIPVTRGYFTEGQREPASTSDLQRGYEVAPDKYVVVRSEELKGLRVATSPDMQILRSVKMQEIDPVFLETSYYVLPGNGGERPYALFYRALAETKLATLAQVAMHGREHIIVLRAGNKGLIAHTMFYINEVRRVDEYSTDTAGVAEKELDLAKKYVEALMEPFQPEEFTDRYRERLQTLIASKEVPQATIKTAAAKNASGKVVDIMDALRKSLETAKAASAERKPVTLEGTMDKKPRKRKA